jgi:hypothetical protein
MWACRTTSATLSGISPVPKGYRIFNYHHSTQVPPMGNFGLRDPTGVGKRPSSSSLAYEESSPSANKRIIIYLSADITIKNFQKIERLE